MSESRASASANARTSPPATTRANACRVASSARSDAPMGIIGHPDVRRMLMSMRACTEAARALSYVTAAALDHAHRHPDAETRRAQAGVRGADDPDRQGLEHGSRATHRLSGRAGARRHGLHRGNRCCAIRARCANHDDLRRHDRHPGERPDRPQDRARCRRGARGRDRGHARGRAANGGCRQSGRRGDRRPPAAERSMRLVEAGRFVVETYRADPRAVLAGAVSFLELAGIVCGGAQLARAASIAAGKLAAGDGDGAFMRAKIATARHFADHYLTHAPGLTRDDRFRRGERLALADEAF